MIYSRKYPKPVDFKGRSGLNYHVEFQQETKKTGHPMRMRGIMFSSFKGGKLSYSTEDYAPTKNKVIQKLKLGYAFRR